MPSSPPPLPPPLERITRTLSNHSISSASSTASALRSPTSPPATRAALSSHPTPSQPTLNGLGLATAHSTTFPTLSPSQRAPHPPEYPPDHSPERTSAKEQHSPPNSTQSASNTKHSRSADSPPSTLVYPASTSPRYSPTRPKTSPEITSPRTIRNRSLSPAITKSQNPSHTDSALRKNGVPSNGGSPASQRTNSAVAEMEESNARTREEIARSPEDAGLGSSVDSLKSRKGKRAAGDLSERNQSRLDSINAQPISPPTQHSATFSNPQPSSPTLVTSNVESQSSYRSSNSDELGRTRPSLSRRESSSELKSVSERDEERARRVRTLGNSTRAPILETLDAGSPQSIRGDRSLASTRIQQTTDTPPSLRRITSRRDEDLRRLPTPSSSNSSTKLSATIRSRPTLPAGFTNEPSPTASPLLSPRTNSPSAGSIRSSYTTTATTVRSARERTKTPDSTSARRWASQVEHSYSTYDGSSAFGGLPQRAITPKADRVKKSSGGSGTGSGSGGGSAGQLERYAASTWRRESDITERSEEADRSLSRSGSVARLRTSSLQSERELNRVGREDRDDVFRNGLQRLDDRRGHTSTVSTPPASSRNERRTTEEPWRPSSRARDTRSSASMYSADSNETRSNRPRENGGLYFSPGSDRDQTLRAINDLLRDQGLVASSITDPRQQPGFPHTAPSKLSSQSSTNYSPSDPNRPRRRASISESIAEPTVSHYTSPHRTRTATAGGNYTPTLRSASRAESIRPTTSLAYASTSTDHHSLLYQALDSFRAKDSSSPESDLFLKLVNSTTKMNTSIRKMVAVSLEANIESQLDERYLSSTVVERGLKTVLRASDDQVRSLTEALIGFTRVEREKGMEERSMSRAGSVAHGRYGSESPSISRSRTLASERSATREGAASSMGGRANTISFPGRSPRTPAVAEPSTPTTTTVSGSAVGSRRDVGVVLRSPLSASPLVQPSEFARSPRTSKTSLPSRTPDYVSPVLATNATTFESPARDPLPNTLTTPSLPFPSRTAASPSVERADPIPVAPASRRTVATPTSASRHHRSSSTPESPESIVNNSTNNRSSKFFTGLGGLVGLRHRKNSSASHSSPSTAPSASTTAMMEEPAREFGASSPTPVRETASPEERRTERRREVEEILRRTNPKPLV